MKILFDHASPFFLAHGGEQIQIEQTKRALESQGVQVDFLRWWDAQQRGDIIHYFGRPAAGFIEFAHARKMKVVLAELLTGLGSRPLAGRVAQKALMKLGTTLLPGAFTEKLAWRSYRLADACVALTPWEGGLMTQMFDAPRERVHVVANGVEEVFLADLSAERGPWIVCTATIAERKRVLELGEAAIVAQTPLWVIGKPYGDGDYPRRFIELAHKHPTLVRYDGGISDRARLAQIYREARGFALLSTMESLSLSALEAAACGCPLLLTDLPWARSVFGANASYCPIANTAATASLLRRFYDAAPSLPVPPKPASWREIAAEFKKLYESLANGRA